MKRILTIATFSLVLCLRATAADPATAQDQQTLALVKEIQAQQIMIAENQAKIEAKLTTVGEAVRVARIYSSRGGH